MSKVILFTDGGARGNPGPAASAYVALMDGLPILKKGDYLGDHLTNNHAEYEGLIRGLAALIEGNITATDVEVKMDSELIVKQMRGEYRVKEAKMKIQNARVQELLKSFGAVTFTHIPRSENADADALVNEALDAVLK